MSSIARNNRRDSATGGKVRKKDTGEQGNGGQFGALARSEANLSITSANDPETRYLTVGWFNEKLRNHFDASALLTRAEVDANRELLDENSVFDRIREDAERLCRRRGAMEHIDDVVMDTAHDVIKRIRESEDRDSKVRAVATASLVRRMVNGHLNHRLTGEIQRSEVRSGQVRLAQREAQRQQELGRSLSARERSQLAAEVRMSFPANNRPPEDFWLSHRDRFVQQDVSETGFDEESWLDRQTRRSLQSALSVSADESALEPSAEEPFPEAIDRSQMDAAEMLYFVRNKDESPVPIHSRSTGTTIYNTLAQSMRVPPARPDSITHRQALGAGRIVRGHERGVQGVCADYLDGVRDERTEALFLPFGDIDQERREAFASRFENNAYAEELWGSALRCADPQLKNFDFPSQMDDQA